MIKYNKKGRLILARLNREELDVCWAIIDWMQEQLYTQIERAREMRAIEPDEIRHVHYGAHATGALSAITQAMATLDKVDQARRDRGR